MNYDESEPAYAELAWDDAEEWERDRLAEDEALERQAWDGTPDDEPVDPAAPWSVSREPDGCDACAGEGWRDIHDQVGDEGDLPRDYELRGGRIHARCRDCNGTGAPF